jgi:hypothetical protein
LLFGELSQNAGWTGVKKSTEKMRKCKPRPVAVKPVALEPVDMAALRGEISNLVCADAVEMVKKIIVQVKGGQYQALKYLFEVIGLFPSTAMQDAPQEDSLAGMLLSRLGIRDEALAEVEPGNQRAKTEVRTGNNVK